MGFGGGKTFLGLFEKERLVAVAAFSKILFMKYENPPYYSAELERFCSLAGVTVVGGLDKLVKYYVNNYKTDDLITYVDQNWSDGAAFKKLGFELIGETEALTFKVNRAAYTRELRRHETEIEADEYLVKNAGNLKFRLTINR